MKETIRKLFTIKSIVTLALTITFVIMSIRGFANKQDIPQYFQTIYTVIVSFYFGTQYEKKDDTNNKVTDKRDNIVEI